MSLQLNPLYSAWRAMRQRCNNTRHAQYKDYGGRGIKVDARWDSYANFAADMGPHPGKGWSLDRIDNNSGYRDGNCRWATQSTQGRNTRVNKLTAADVASIRAAYTGSVRRGGTISQADLALQYGVSRSLIVMVLNSKRWR